MEAGSWKLRLPGWSSSSSNDDDNVLPTNMIDSFFDEALPIIIISPQVAPPSRFAKPRTDEEIQEAKQAAVCAKTQQDTKW